MFVLLLACSDFPQAARTDSQGAALPFGAPLVKQRAMVKMAPSDVRHRLPCSRLQLAPLSLELAGLAELPRGW